MNQEERAGYEMKEAYCGNLVNKLNRGIHIDVPMPTSDAMCYYVM